MAARRLPPAAARSLAALALLAALAPAAAAAPGAPAPAAAPGAAPAAALTLTVQDVRRIALERSREIRRAEQYAASVHGRYDAERAAAFPQLSLSSTLSHQIDRSALFGGARTDVLAAGARLTQPLFTFGRIPAAIRAARVGLATAGDRMRLARLTAVRDGLLAWYDALLARELRDLAGQNLSQKERLLAEARRRLEAGTATDYDVLSAGVSVENARPEVIRSENLVGATLERLRFVLALEEGTALELGGSLDARPEPVPAYAEALETARRRRPDLAELRNQRRVADEVVTIQRAGTKPRLDLSAGAGWQRLAVDGPNGEGPLWSAGVALSWPIYDGRRTRGLVEEAESDAATLAIGERELLDSIALETRRAIDDVREAAGIMEALAGTVAQAERLLAMSEKGYGLGVKTRLDVDDAQLNLLLARGNLARARRDCLAARAALAFVTGEE